MATQKITAYGIYGHGRFKGIGEDTEYPYSTEAEALAAAKSFFDGDTDILFGSHREVELMTMSDHGESFIAVWVDYDEDPTMWIPHLVAMVTAA